MNQESISKYISNLRKKHNLTQAEMAKRLSVTAQAVSKWENARGIPDIELLKKISDEFNVNIEDILNGKTRPNKKKRTIIYIILVFLFFIIIGIVIFKVMKNDFHFSSLSSNNDAFVLSGVAAYSNDKKSIYISEIKYNKEDKLESKYFLVECSLYETVQEHDYKITSCANINPESHEDQLKSIEDLLNNIELRVDNYNSACKELTSDNLYLLISVLDINNKITTHKITINVKDNCDK